MSDAAKKNPLDDEPFSYRQYKNGNVSVYYQTKEVTALKGKKAEKFTAQMLDSTDVEAQLIMAKITGNFKRGNERLAKLKGK